MDLMTMLNDPVVAQDGTVVKHEGTATGAVKGEPHDDPPSSSVGSALQRHIRPKCGIGLRGLTGTAAAAVTDALVDADVAAGGAPADAETTPGGRLSMEEYEKKTMDSMQTVKERRAAEREAKKKEQAELAARDLVLRKPAAAVKAVPKVKAEKAMKVKAGTAMKAKKEVRAEVSANKVKAERADREWVRAVLKRPAANGAKRPRCPAATVTTPVHYNGGVIYNPASEPKFRCIRTKGDYYSEKSCAWSGGINAARDKALAFIDEARKSAHKK